MNEEKERERPALSPLKRAYLALEELQDKIARLEARDREPIAIVGIGCRMPGGVADAEGLVRLLRDEVDAVLDAPPDGRESYRRLRTDVTPALAMPPAGFLAQDVAGFDSQFFSIAPREAVGMDPQQRLLLEVAWEALEDATEAPAALYESRAGVFVGIASGDYAQLMMSVGDSDLLNAHLTSGVGHSVASGRISYLLGLQGPSISVDTACSSSLVATHLACRSLRARECDVALAGGVNVILDTDWSVAFMRSGMLSADGRCKTFADGADGFARGEGCGIVVLKRLADALADGNRIYALIRGTAINQDGPSSALSAPNGPAQEAVIRAALADAGLAPADVDYVEAHGTGTELGDPIEMRALGNVYGSAPGRKQPLVVGSIKTNVGHLESAAGIAGLLKAALSLERSFIPKHLHFATPSRHIAWSELNVEVAYETRLWPAGARPSRGAVSSFGYSGTNCHIILEQAPTVRPRSDPIELDRPRLVTLSAATRAAVAALAVRYGERLRGVSNEDAADVCFTSQVGRAHLSHRLCVVGRPRELAARLEQWASEGWATGAAAGRTPVEPPRVAFAFTGQGSQYAGMARRLHAASPRFRDALDSLGPAFSEETGESLLDVLHGARTCRLHDTRIAQPALFAVEWALAHVLQEFGIRPAAVFGHSLGEYVAAAVAGVFSATDGLTLVARRGRLMDEGTAGGAMLAVAADEHTVADAIAEIGLSIAAVNGPQAVVVSGTREAVGSVEGLFAKRGVRIRRLDVSRAFHSPLMDPILDAFEAEVRKVALQSPRIRIISTMTGEPLKAADVVSSTYWRRHVREPVRFAAAAASFAQSGGIVVEVGPHHVLSTFERDGKAAELAFVPTLRRGADDVESLLTALQTLYVAGRDVDWRPLHDGESPRRVQLPLYQFQRQRYWFSARPRTVEAGLRGVDTGHPLLGRRLDSPMAEAQFETAVNRERFGFIADHRVADATIMPGAAFIEAVRAAGECALGVEVVVRDLELLRALAVPDGGCLLQTVVAERREDGASVRFFSRRADADESWTVHASARVAPARCEAPHASSGELDSIRARCTREVEHSEFYAELAGRRLDFGPSLRGLKRAWSRDGEALAEIELPEPTACEAAAYAAHPALVDACLQAVAVALAGSVSSDALFLPVRIGRFRVLRPNINRCYVHARCTVKPDSPSLLYGEIAAYDDRGEPLLLLEGLEFQAATRTAPEQLGGRHVEQYLYEVAWQSVSASEGAGSVQSAARAWLERLPADLSRRAAVQKISEYDRFFADFEELCADYFGTALLELGWSPTLPPLSADALANRLAVAPQHGRLFGRMLEILAEASVLSEKEGLFSAGARAPRSDATERLRVLEARYPAARAEIALVGRAAPALARTLRGECDPLELLFPGGSLTDAEHLYRDSPLAVVFNSSIADAIERIVESCGRVRILEIGGGTGGTTSHVIERVGASVDYTFTDVSPLFTSRARERIAARNNVVFKELDIELDPAAQGFDEHGYDVVIASNVLHATEDMRRTMRHVARMLAPGGVLIALEVLAPHRWFDLTVGTTPGWWKFKDLGLRPSYPTLTAEGWKKLLETESFNDSRVIVGEPGGSGVLGRQGIILASAPTRPITGRRPWLILADRGGCGGRVAELLTAEGHSCRIVAADDLYGSARSANEDARERLAKLVEDRGGDGWEAVVYLHALDEALPLDSADADLDLQLETACAGALDLVIACIGVEPQRVPRVFVVTRGGQAVTGDESYLRPAQATVWGLGRTVDLEHPTLELVRIDLDPSNPYDQADALVTLMTKRDVERQVAFRDGQLLAPRMQRWCQRARKPADGPYALVCREPGLFDALEFRPTDRRVPGPGEVEIAVEATGLNFKDVLNVLGLYPGDPGPLGSECAGVVARIGPNVTTLAPGDAVMAFVGGAYDRFVIAPAHQIALIPQGISIERAATIPVPFLTAAYALEHCARLSAGERVLIHAAAGGVGLAAVQLAQRAGAQIYATAGTSEKRKLLRRLGVRYVYDSRCTDFADDVLCDTGGRGVDVVLNSLADEFVGRSFDATAVHGRFLEIGKRGIWEPDRVAALGKNIEYHVVDWGETARRQPALIAELFEKLVERFRQRELVPLPVRVFRRERLRDAFRYMAQGRHIGKIAVAHEAAAERIRGVKAIRADATYVIAGGLSGLGLLSARWLVNRGARHLALIGRRPPDEHAKRELVELEACGARLAIGRLDITDADSLRDFLQDVRDQLPPIRGVLQSAGVLDDGVLQKQSWLRFLRVFAPKVQGSSNLVELTRRDPLDFFVMYSSLASMVGSAGQANHAAANAFLDVLAAARSSEGCTALSINWGPWSEAGAAVRHGVIGRGAVRGLHAISPEQGFSALELLLASGAVQAGVANVDWDTFLGGQRSAPFFESLHSMPESQSARVAAEAQDASGWLDRLAHSPPAKRRSVILRFVKTEVARLLGLPGDEVETDRPLSEMGLDSLLAVEIRNFLGKTFDLTLPATITFDHPSIEALAAYMQSAKFPEVDSAVKNDDYEAVGIADIENLSEDELDRLIAERLRVND